jgi:regulatory protein
VDASEIDAGLLENWALAYLGRYASSATNLRRVLLRRLRRRLRDNAEVLHQVEPLIEALVERYLRSGLLNDAAYAASRAEALHRRGESLAKTRARLAAKGVTGALATEALAALRPNSADPDLAAACAFARRRRLGPYRRFAVERTRELAAFARAGFSRRVAEAVLACTDTDAAEALARGDLD